MSKNVIDFKKFKKYYSGNGQDSPDPVEIDKPIFIGWSKEANGEKNLFVYSPFPKEEAMFMIDMAKKIIECRPPDLVDDFDWDDETSD